MDLFIVRHAVAVKVSPGREDARRPLTARGAQKFKRSVQGLAALGVRFDRLYHSPWQRAVETADLAMPLLEGKRVATENLATFPRAALLDELKGKRVAVVGHEPWLSQLLAWLLLGDAQEGERFVLKKGSVAWLTGEPQPGKMQLNALFPPRALRKLERR